jgi:CRP-like cAMP-binding protein
MNLGHLRKISDVRHFDENTDIVTEGESGASMFIILAGTVTITKNRRIIAELSEGSFFGEMSLFLGKNRTATITAKTKVTALEINKENALNFFRDETETTFELIKTICQRLDEQNYKFVQTDENLKLIMENLPQ